MSQFIELLSSLKATILSGIFLSVSLVFYLMEKSITFDPAWASIFISGLPIVYAAVTKLFFQKRITSSLLITIAMAASIWIGEYFAAGEIAFIMAIGEILEDRTVNRAKKGIHKLIALAPQKGRIIEGSEECMVPVKEIKKGQFLRVLPGETVPVDGRIISGTTSIDQSVITGESLPVDKGCGDTVFAGTINRFGTIDMEATKVGEDSSLQKLIRMVQEAEENRAPMQRVVDTWATWLVPAALLISIITYFAMGDISRAVTVLVVFCPCALVLATPTSIMAGIGQATRNGVLIKSGEALEKMGKVNSLAFDKTGTLTRGDLRVSNIISLSPEYTEEALLALTSSVESGSEHPLGKAIVAKSREEDIPLEKALDFLAVPGKGISALINGKRVFCGNQAFMQENGIHLDEFIINNTVRPLLDEGKALIYTGSEGKLLGVMALSDTLRPEVPQVISELKDASIKSILLTGDNNHAASYLASKAGVEIVHSNLLPEHKVEWLCKYKESGHIIAMVGDGVNDAPAMKTADAGIAMGGMGSDITLDAADIVLMGDDLTKLPYLQRLSRATIRSIKLNIFLSMAINFIAICLSIAGILTPVTGALVHNAGSVLVVLNAALLYDRNFLRKKKT